MFYRQLEQQSAHPAAQRIQLAFQDIGEDSWEVGSGVLGIKVAGVEKDGLFDVFILESAVVLAVVKAYLVPCLIA